MHPALAEDNRIQPKHEHEQGNLFLDAQGEDTGDPHPQRLLLFDEEEREQQWRNREWHRVEFSQIGRLKLG